MVPRSVSMIFLLPLSITFWAAKAIEAGARANVRNKYAVFYHVLKVETQNINENEHKARFGNMKKTELKGIREKPKIKQVFEKIEKNNINFGSILNMFKRKD